MKERKIGKEDCFVKRIKIWGEKARVESCGHNSVPRGQMVVGLCRDGRGVRHGWVWGKCFGDVFPFKASQMNIHHLREL